MLLTFKLQPKTSDSTILLQSHTLFCLYCCAKFAAMGCRRLFCILQILIHTCSLALNSCYFNFFYISAWSFCICTSRSGNKRNTQSNESNRAPWRDEEVSDMLGHLWKRFSSREFGRKISRLSHLWGNLTVKHLMLFLLLMYARDSLTEIYVRVSLETLKFLESSTVGQRTFSQVLDCFPYSPVESSGVSWTLEGQAASPVLHFPMVKCGRCCGVHKILPQWIVQNHLFIQHISATFSSSYP